MLPFFFWLPNPPLLIQFARGIWASVSKSVSYVFPQRPVSFVNICLAAGISGPHRTSLLTFAASFCCISHLELWLCSLCVLENAGVRVHNLSRYCRECTHLIRSWFCCRCHGVLDTICPTCCLLQTLVMRALFLLAVLWQLVYVWWEALAFILTQRETRLWKTPAIDVSSSYRRHARHTREITVKSLCIITLFWRSHMPKHKVSPCAPDLNVTQLPVVFPVINAVSVFFFLLCVLF